MVPLEQTHGSHCLGLTCDAECHVVTAGVPRSVGTWLPSLPKGLPEAGSLPDCCPAPYTRHGPVTAELGECGPWVWAGALAVPEPGGLLGAGWAACCGGEHACPTRKLLPAAPPQHSLGPACLGQGALASPATLPASWEKRREGSKSPINKRIGNCDELRVCSSE